MNFFNYIKSMDFVYKPIKKVYDYYSFVSQDRKMKKMNQKSSHESVIRIIFISQMPGLWENLQPIYERLSFNSKFDVTVLAIPECNYDTYCFSDESLLSNKTYQYHLDIGTKVVNAYQQGWISLIDLHPDYVFYERPYSHYLPELYRINNVINFSKTVYLPYGYENTSDLFSTTLNTPFMKYLYLFFADSIKRQNFILSKDCKSYSNHIRQCFRIVHPIFLSMLSAKNKKSIFWNAHDLKFKVMYTPRWTIDKKLGGSSFFEYKNNIVDFCAESKDIEFVFRPHPLMFKNFMDIKLMTQDEVNRYLDFFHENKNLHYDETNEYFSTFWNSDVLISDFSSIVMYYLITGKPVIYCSTREQKKVEFDAEVLDILYVAYDWNDVQNYLFMLKSKKDPLKEKRLKFVHTEFNENMILETPKIVEQVFLEDYFNNAQK